MTRTIVIAAGALLVVGLAVRSDFHWRQFEQRRREEATIVTDDPSLAAEVREAADARKRLRQLP